MYSLRRCIVLLFLCLGIAPLVVLAEDCPAIVQAALTAADASCSTTGRNQACYGNVQLVAVPQPNAAEFVFNQPGDKVDVSGLQSLQLSSMDEVNQQWGVAVMRLQANLPDTLPGQNVTLVLFGNVELTPAVSAPITLDITAKSKANVRGTPSTSGAVVGSLASGQTIMADGRNSDSTWLRIQLEDGNSGWVFANLITPSGDVSTLAEVDANGPATPQSQFGAGQAFYFKSSGVDTPCAEAPNGLLIQSPAGAQRVELTVNDVTLSIGSTAFLQTAGDTSGEMTVSALSGLIQIEAGGVTQNVIEGAQSSVTLDAEGKAAGTPSDPQPYDSTLLTPVVSNMIQGRQLFVPLEDDSSDLLKSLIEACSLTPISADQPILSLSADEVKTATACVADYLASQVTLPTAGMWSQEPFRMEISGQCLSSSFGGGDGDGGADLPLVPVYGVKVDGKPYIILNEGQAYPHIDGTPDRFGGDRAPYFDALRDNSFQTIGTIKTTYTDQYQVVSPDEIVVTISSVEEGGCSMSGSYTMKLVQPDDSVIDQSKAEEIIANNAQYAAQAEPELVEGTYSGDYSMQSGECTGDAAPPDLKEISIAKIDEYTYTFTAGANTYTVYKMGGGSYGYDTGFGQKHLQVSLFASESSLNFSWFASEGSDAPCSAFGDLTQN